MCFQWRMRYKILFFLLAAQLLAGCSRNMELTTYYKTVGLQISPSSSIVKIGSNHQFSAWLVDEVGGTREASNVLWRDLYGYVGTMEPDGSYIPNHIGRTEISASSEGFLAIATIEVVAGTAASIEIYPTDLTLAVGDKVRLYGYVNDRDGNRVADVSGNQNYWSPDGTIFTIDSILASAVYVVANAPGNGWVEISWEGMVKRVTIPVISTPNYSYIGKWSAAVAGTSEAHPVSISVSSDGNIWVGLYDYPSGIFSRIQKYDDSGNLLSTLGAPGTGEGEFNRPNDIAFDGDGNMYVADSENALIQKFSPTGDFIRLWNGSNGSGGRFSYPVRIAVRGGNIYVSDYMANCIQKFDLDGNYILKWGRYGSANGSFRNSCGICVDSNGDVYVADQANYRIQKFDCNGNFIKTWGNLGYGVGQFANIVGLAVDASDNIYVADAGSDFISKFDKNGNFITRWGGTGSANGLLDGPFDVAVDSSGNVYVADYNNKRIQKFRP